MIPYMAYPRPTIVEWDRNKSFQFQGVTIKRVLDDGKLYAWYVPYNGVLTQAMAADVLDVSVMTINNWVNAGLLKTIKQRGVPSLISLYDLKRVAKKLDAHRRLRREAYGQ